MVMDIVLCAIILFCLFNGLKKGFIKSLLGFFGSIISVIASAVLSNVIAVTFYQSFLKNVLIEKISTVLTVQTGGETRIQMEALFSSLPKFIKNVLDSQGITLKSLEATLSGAASAVAPQVAEMISPIIINLIRMVLAVVLFSLFMFLIRLLVRSVGALFRMPLLKQFNSILGGTFGLLNGLLIVMLLCAILQLAAPMLEAKSFGITQQQIESSFVFKYIYQNNPVYSLFKLD